MDGAGRDRRVLPPDRAAFAWDIPDRLNIAERCCDSWAALAPDRVALRHVGANGAVTDWSYGALKDASDRLAAVLAARGVGRGDRVALLLSQGPEVMLGHFAAMKLGAVSLPLFTLFGPEALRFRLADSAAKVAITDGANLPKLTGLRDELPDLEHLICIDPGQGVPALYELIAATDPIARSVDTAAEDPAMMIYTSGTTGPPKGVLHAHRFLLGHLPCMEVNHADLPLPDDVGWTPADWAWIGGLMDLAMPSLYYGVRLVSHRMRKFDAGAAWDLIARERVTRLFLPPAALRAMRTVPVPQGVAVRSIGSGGESLGADLIGWGRETLGAEINELYGQTECNLVVASDAARGVQKQGYMGRAVPGHDVAVIDAGGTPVLDQLGEIAVRRPDPGMFLRYWNRPEKTVEKFAGDWMRTGDLGRMDRDGYVAFVSRDDDVINSSGYRIGPSEIEGCLCAHPAVAAAAVVGLPDPQRGEAVTAFVVLADGVDPAHIEATLIAHVRKALSPHMAPRAVHLRVSLPVTATGKIMRRALRDDSA